MPIAIKAIFHGRAIGGLKADFTRHRPNDFPSIEDVPDTNAKIVACYVVDVANAESARGNAAGHLISRAREYSTA